MNALTTLIILLLSTISIGLLSFSPLSEVVQQQILAFIVFLTILSIRILPKRIHVFLKYQSITLLFLSSMLVQYVVLMTGGLQSPFFMLLHFYTLGVSFLLHFSAGFIFLFLSLCAVILDGYFQANFLTQFYEHPESIVFIVTSLLIVLPVAELLSRKYKLKDHITSVLRDTIRLQSSVLDEINELVFITDTKFSILSINETVEKALFRSSSELLGKNFFEVVLLKDGSGKLASATSVDIQQLFSTKKQYEVSGLTLLTTHGISGEVVLTMKPIVSFEGNIQQVVMVVQNAKKEERSQSNLPFLEEARLKLLARIESLQQATLEKGMKEMYSEVSTIATTEHDIITVSLLNDPQLDLAKTKIDLAQLAKQMVTRKRPYFDIIGVKLEFELINFGIDDIRPLVPINFHINPEEFTGPFFTVECQANLTNTLIVKLLEVAVLLSSSQEYPYVRLGVEKDGIKDVLITVSTHTRGIVREDLEDLFISNYRKLSEKMNLRLGSGLEGYIVKNIVYRLGLPFQYHLSDSGELEFMVRFSKG